MGGSVFVGRVVSNRMQKTAVVAVHYALWVPKYKVYQKRVSRHQAHDEQQACVVGDVVRIQATRKLSKHKSYRVTDIIRRASVFDLAEAAHIAAERDALRPAPSALDAARVKLDEAAERLRGLREMYAKEIQGAVPGNQGIKKSAGADGSRGRLTARAGGNNAGRMPASPSPRPASASGTPLEAGASGPSRMNATAVPEPPAASSGSPCSVWVQSASASPVPMEASCFAPQRGGCSAGVPGSCFGARSAWSRAGCAFSSDAAECSAAKPRAVRSACSTSRDGIPSMLSEASVTLGSHQGGAVCGSRRGAGAGSLPAWNWSWASKGC